MSTGVNKKVIRLVVSVRNAEEAEAAIVGGADLVDIKDPSQGPLGAASIGDWKAVSATISGRKPHSMALGEIEEISKSFPFSELAGAKFAKVGLARTQTLANLPERLAWVGEQLPNGTSLVPVIYGDWQSVVAPSPGRVIELAHLLGCSGVLFDTYCKDGRSLFDYLDLSELSQLLDSAQEGGLFTCLAGALNARTLPRAMDLQPEFVAVRGAVCRTGDRLEKVDENAVKAIARELVLNRT